MLSQDVEKIHQHKQKLLSMMLDMLRDVDGIQLFGPKDDIDRTAIVPIIIPGIEPKIVADILWKEYKIAVRAGCHCAPQIHFDIGAPQGTVRFSFGAFNTVEDVEYAAEAVIEIVKNYAK